MVLMSKNLVTSKNLLITSSYSPPLPPFPKCFYNDGVLSLMGGVSSHVEVNPFFSFVFLNLCVDPWKEGSPLFVPPSPASRGVPPFLFARQSSRLMGLFSPSLVFFFILEVVRMFFLFASFHRLSLVSGALAPPAHRMSS